MDDIVRFIKNPTYSESFKPINWKIFFLLFFIYFVLVIPLGFVARIVSYQCDFTSVIPAYTLSHKIFLAIIFAPVVEELFFRMPLVFTKKNLYISVCCGLILGVRFYLNGRYSIFVVVAPIVFVGILAILYFNKCKAFVAKRYGLFFYTIAALFGLIHIFNFDGITAHNFIFTPLIVMPQLLMGVLFGFIRATYGIGYSILFHAIVNALFVMFIM